MPGYRRACLALLLPFAAALCAAQQDESALAALRRLNGGAPAAEVPSVLPAALVRPAAAGTGAQLLASLHELSGQGFRQHDYGEASNFLFSTADNIARDGRRGVADAYSGVFVAGTSTEGSE